MMKQILISLSLSLLLLASCAAPGPTPTLEPPSTPTAEPQGPSYVDQAQLLVLESFPVQVQLQVSGDLPTPCYELHFEVAPPDEDNHIMVTVWSEAHPELICPQVTEPFEESISIPMDGQPDGRYSVWLNGEQVGEFSYPG